MKTFFLTWAIFVSLSVKPSQLQAAELFLAGPFNFCADVKGAGLSCWGDETRGFAKLPESMASGSLIFNGVAEACGKTSSGTPVCWGSHGAERLLSFWQPKSQMSHIFGKGSHFCGFEREELSCFQTAAQNAGLEIPSEYLRPRLFDAGYYFSCAVKDNTPACWGALMQGAKIPSELTDVEMLSAGIFHACAANRDGRVRCWALEEAEQLKTKTKNLQLLVAGNPPEEGFQTFMGVHMVDDGILRLMKKDGSMTNERFVDDPQNLKALVGYCVQDGTTLHCSELSVPSSENPEIPQSYPARTVELNIDAKALNPRKPHSHFCFLREGEVRCLGSGNVGQVGAVKDKPTTRFADAKVVSFPQEFVPKKVLSKLGKSCALSIDGRLSCWGQLGAVDPRMLNDTFKKKIKDFSMGETFICALFEDSAVACIGEGYGEFPTPKDSVAALVSSDQATCLIDDSGKTTCFGTNEALIPADPLPPLKKIASGRSHFCGIQENNTVACFGHNQFGQLALGHMSDANTLEPALLGSDITAKDLSCGNNHCCIITEFNTLKCWGNNTFGQLGLGDSQDKGISSETTGDELKAVKMPELEAVLSVDAFDDSTCAVTKSGKRCWGYNGQGQLGYGDRKNRGDQSDSLPRLLDVVAD